MNRIKHEEENEYTAIDGRSFGYKIIMLMNCYERESVIAKLINKRIKENNPMAEVLVLYYSLGVDLVDIIDFNPDAVMSYQPSFLELINLLAIIKKVCGCRVLTYTTEGFSTDDGEVLGLYGLPNDLIDAWGVWGNEYKSRLEKSLCKKLSTAPVIKVFGYVLWEHDKVNQILHNETDYEIDTNYKGYSKTILVLSGFAESYKRRKDLLDSVDAYDTTLKRSQIEAEIDRMENYVRRQEKYRDEYYRLIRTLAMYFKDYCFIMKLHPKEIELINCGENLKIDIIDNVENIKIIDRTVPFSMLCEQVDGVIHYGSTISWEAYIHNIPCICIKFRSNLRVPGLVYDFNDDELVNRLRNLNDANWHNDDDDQYVYNWFNYSCEDEYHPSDKIAKWVLQAAELDKSKIETEDLHRVMFWGSRLEYISCARLFFRKKVKESLRLFIFMMKRKCFVCRKYLIRLVSTSKVERC